MTRYLRKCRIAGLAGLASLAVWAIPAAPAGAKTVCVQGVPPTTQTVCHQVISISITVTVSPTHAVSVKVKVTDPHLNVKLYKKKGTKYKLVKTVFNGNVTGAKKLKIGHLKRGKYELKVKATVPATSTAPAASKTVKKFFKVK